MTVEIEPREAELIAGGTPLAPEHISMTMFDRAFPLTHASAVVVQDVPEFGCVVLAIGRPDMAHGLFMGLSPALARSVAAWLQRHADLIDGGAVKQ